MIGYLKSYDEKMTSATARCVAGCKCSPVVMQGYDPKDHTSITMFADVHIPQPEKGQMCRLQLTANSNDRNKAAKFKFNSLIVLESATHTPNLSGGSLTLPHRKKRRLHRHIHTAR